MFLISAKINGMEIDECPRCKGIWLAQEVLENVIIKRKSYTGKEKKQVSNFIMKEAKDLNEIVDEIIPYKILNNGKL
jgi:Zn-finger nucleic acid-binding protein